MGIKTYYHAINEKDRENGHLSYRHYKRRFFKFYREEDVDKGGHKVIGEKQLFGGHFDTIVERNPHGPLSIRFHIGNEGSETPWDGHFILFGVGFYWGLETGRKLAGFLTRCKGYKWDSREFALRIFDKTLWWNVATHSDMCEVDRAKQRYLDLRKLEKVKTHGKKYRRPMRLREGNVSLDFVSMILGKKEFIREPIESWLGDLQFAEGAYPVFLTVERTVYGRPKAKHKEIKYVIEVDAKEGIPYMFDKSGGWKGDRVYGFSVAFPGYGGRTDWWVDAQNLVMAYILNERGRTHFREPLPVEKG